MKRAITPIILCISLLKFHGFFEALAPFRPRRGLPRRKEAQKTLDTEKANNINHLEVAWWHC